MSYKSFLFIFLSVAMLPTNVPAAEPVSNQPEVNPVPYEFGSGSARQLVPLPPSLPPYLPNGAINLDEVWTQDGGARLYWNDVIIPTQLKMAGASWIDPALVPQLIPDKKAPTRRYYRRSSKVAKTKVKVPPKVASTALKSPAIPLPVTPEPNTNATNPIPPLKAGATDRINITTQDTPRVTPPRLQ